MPKTQVFFVAFKHYKHKILGLNQVSGYQTIFHGLNMATKTNSAPNTKILGDEV
jgi:hypothetical protein